jgi:hypothetical protein
MDSTSNSTFNTPTIPLGRRKLIWWCCLLRDRLLALGLRRTQCLHEDRAALPMVSEEDFGLETVFPRYVDRASKLQSIDNFISQCELSQVVVRILRFQERRECAMEKGKPSGEDKMELREVVSLHSQLMAWKEKFNYLLQERTETSAPTPCTMPCQLTQIFYKLSSTFGILPRSLCADRSISVLQ